MANEDGEHFSTDNVVLLRAEDSILHRSPLAMLKELVRQIETGVVTPDAFVLVFRNVHADAVYEDGEEYPIWTQGFTRLELLGLLAEVMRKL